MNEEQVYTVGEVSKMLQLSERTVVKIFENEKGTLVYEVPRLRKKRASYRTIRIPRHVYERVLRRISVP